MTALFARQSELSIASFWFYTAGGVFSLLVITLFRNPEAPANPFSPLVAIAAFAAALTVLLLGRRFGTPVAIAMVCVSATVVLAMVTTTATEQRAMNSGLMFTTFLLYLVWFGPMWFARLFGYVWLAAYWAVTLLRFGAGEILPFLVTLSVTAVVLGELIGRFKGRLEENSLTDPLCGVWNKRAFGEVLQKSVSAAQRGRRSLSLVFLDLDDFKTVNDVQGHGEGDRVLREFAARIDRSVRPQDFFARMGGDEFVLLLRDMDAVGAERIAARLRSETVEASWSFGIAQWEPGETTAEFLRRADELMLAQKRERKAAR